MSDSNISTTATIPTTRAATATTQLVGHDGPIHVVRFTADGKYGWTAGHDRTVRLWNPFKVDPLYVARSFYKHSGDTSSTMEIPHALGLQTFSDGYTYPIYAMAVNAASTLLLASSDRNVILTDVLTQKLQRRIAPAHEAGRVNCLSFWDSHEPLWASGSVDATVQLWDVRSSASVQTLKDAKDSITAVFLCPKGEILTASVDGCLRTYDVRRGQVRCDALVLPDGQGGNKENGGGDVPPIVSMDVSERLVLLGCLDNSLRLLERSTGEVLSVFHGAHVCQSYAVECGFVSLSAANTMDVLATGSEDGGLGFYSCWHPDHGGLVVAIDNEDDDGKEKDKEAKTETKEGEEVQQRQLPFRDRKRRPVCSIATRGSQVLAASYNGVATLYQYTATPSTLAG